MRAALTTDKILWAIVGAPPLVIDEDICVQGSKLDRTVSAMARRSPIAKRLMTVSGVGIVTALTFMAVIDTPARFRRSSDAAAYIGLTPRRYQSGQVDYSGTHLQVRQFRVARLSLLGWLYGLEPREEVLCAQELGAQARARKGFRKAAVAVARKIAVIMHRIWSDGTVFQWTSRKGDVAVA